MANDCNSRNGANFENAVSGFLAEKRILVGKHFAVDIGVASKKRSHKFDLGNDDPRIVVECKCHTWLPGGNYPSAKMSVWNEAMYYFSLVPDDFQKMFFVLLDRSWENNETLADCYIRRHGHLIPFGVEIWEFDNVSKEGECVYPASRRN